MNTRTDLELTLKDVPQHEAGELWERLSLVAQGFLRDGREVELVTYHFPDGDDDIEISTNPPNEETRR